MRELDGWHEAIGALGGEAVLREGIVTQEDKSYSLPETFMIELDERVETLIPGIARIRSHHDFNSVDELISDVQDDLTRRLIQSVDHQRDDRLKGAILVLSDLRTIFFEAQGIFRQLQSRRK